jgi:hypothetical protein
VRTSGTLREKYIIVKYTPPPLPRDQLMPLMPLGKGDNIEKIIKVSVKIATGVVVKLYR